MAHTPGPYTTERRQATTAVLGADGNILGEVYGRVTRGPAVEKANADLWAAAPDLLTVCEAVVAYSETTLNCAVCTLGEDGDDHDDTCVVPAARAAIAKAKGE